MSSTFDNYFNHRVMVFNSAAQTIASGNNADINFNITVYDTINSHNNITNNERLNVNGQFNLIKINYLLSLSVTAAGLCVPTIKKNGSGLPNPSLSFFKQLSAPFDYINITSCILMCQTNDFFTINLINNTAGNIVVLANQGFFAAEFGIF